MTDWWTERDAITAYPSRLFDENDRLARDRAVFFPRDRQAFDRALDSQDGMDAFWRNALPHFLRRGPWLRDRGDLSDMSVDTILTPLLHLTASELFAEASESPAFAEQTARYDELANRAKLLVSNLDSLYYWSMEYRNAAITLLRLHDETDEKRRSLEQERYSERVRLLREEEQRLLSLLNRSNIAYRKTLAQFRARFDREIAERERVVDVLTNYLSGTLFRLGGNPNYVQPRRELPSLRGTPLNTRLERLIPMYRRFRSVLLERQQLRPLVQRLIEHERGSSTNALASMYF